MASRVQVIFTKAADGTSSVCFEIMVGLEKYALAFCGHGKVTLHVPDLPQGMLMRLGQALIISRALKIDFRKIRIQAVSSPGSASGNLPASQVMIKDLEYLCGFINMYFKDRAAFYWGVLSADCHIKDGCVCTSQYKIAYHQLVEIDAGFYYKNRKVA
jgi:hypothetical protein